MENNIENEVWRDVDGYDGMYQVSDLGRVRSRYSGEWRVLRPGKTNVGYLRVNLKINGSKNNFLIHRLVAQAFIPNDDESKNQVNHKDENKQNNRVDNLEWCTAQYNMTYNDLHHRHITKRTKVKDIYDPNLSIPKNLEIFRANGIECGRSTVIQLRKDLGLTRKYTKRS